MFHVSLPLAFFGGVFSILRETASISCSSALSPVRSVPTKDAERLFLLHEPAPGHVFLRIHPLSILLYAYNSMYFGAN